MKQGFKLIKMIHFLDRSFLPLYLLAACAGSALPFITMIGSVRVLDDLLAGNGRQAFLAAAVMLAAEAVVRSISCYLHRKAEAKSMTINRRCNGQIILKSIRLDYAAMEEKECLEEFQAADYQMARNGGFGSYADWFFKLLCGCMSAIYGIFFLLRLTLAEETALEARMFLKGLWSLLPVGLAFGLVFLCNCIWFRRMGETAFAMRKELMDANQRMNYSSFTLPMDETLAKEIRLYRMKDWLMEQWERLSEQVRGVFGVYWRFEERHLLRLSLLNDFVLLLAYAFAAAKVWAHVMTAGAFLGFSGALVQIHTGLRSMAQAAGEIRRHQSYLSFYTDFLEKENRMHTGSLPVEKRRDNEYEIEFHDVGFRYPGSPAYSLRHISLKLSLKHKFAVVGRNGAGKTTLIKLLCRFYDPTEGVITLNGVDIRKYDYEAYQSLFAAVFQDFSLFPMTVGENVACSKTKEPSKLDRALLQAGIKRSVDALEHGADTLLFHGLGDGVELSGGEAQKLALARALYKDAPFVILDEPTAALDPVGEYELYTRFEQMVREKTSIYISHRMSSCRFCDEILVFEQGCIVQRGSHKQLMAEEGKLYQQLWNAQAKYYANAEIWKAL